MKAISHFLPTTILRGALFLIPTAVLAFLLSKALEFARRELKPVAKLIPINWFREQQWRRRWRSPSSSYSAFLPACSGASRRHPSCSNRRASRANRRHPAIGSSDGYGGGRSYRDFYLELAQHVFRPCFLRGLERAPFTSLSSAARPEGRSPPVCRLPTLSHYRRQSTPSRLRWRSVSAVDVGM